MTTVADEEEKHLQNSTLQGLFENKRRLRAKEVCAYLSISRSTLYRKIRDQEFPQPESLGHKIKFWTVETILDWLETER